jgi:hypothetical protein
MENKNKLEKVSEETMRFMRGKYVLDEVGNGKDELKFRRGSKTILTIYIREDRFDFLVIFGKAEQEKFESQRDKFPQKIQEIYDSGKTYHDGKWMTVPVADMKTLETVKELILIKKKPNRKPFQKDQAVYSRCGQRCDLCLHYSKGSITEDYRKESFESFFRVYKSREWNELRCTGCLEKPADDNCKVIRCIAEKGCNTCNKCGNYPCALAPLVTSRIRPESVLADDITRVILPFVHEQYGN